MGEQVLEDGRNCTYGNVMIFRNSEVVEGRVGAACNRHVQMRTMTLFAGPEGKRLLGYPRSRWGITLK